MATFAIEPLSRFGGASTSIRRPREVAYFSYDDHRNLHPLSDQSLSYYYPPIFDIPGESGHGGPRINLSNGYESFRKHNDTVNEHLDALLDTLAAHEEKEGQIVKADVLTWRGMMTKVTVLSDLIKDESTDHDRQIMTAPFDIFNEFEMNATCYQVRCARAQSCQAFG